MSDKEAMKIVLEAARKILKWDVNEDGTLFNALVKVEVIYEKMKGK